MNINNLYSSLDSVVKDKVFYGSNVYDNGTNAEMPFIVYQEVTKRPANYSDDSPTFYRSSYQITLVTKSKDLLLEEKLEKALLGASFCFTLVSEYRNEDKSLNRVYQIEMEGL